MNKAVLAVAALLLAPSAAFAQYVKDFVEIDGARSNKLRGYGIVTGLGGNGDSPKEESARVLRNFLQNLLPPDTVARSINARNAALVVVTTELPPFQKEGTRLDVTVSAVGDAKTLHGGDLQLTDLRGPLGRQDPKGRIYALASGRVIVQGDSRRGNHTTGTVPGGAIVETELEHKYVQEIMVRAGDGTVLRKAFKLVLKKPDLTTVSSLVQQINDKAAVGPAGRFQCATTLDGGSFMVRVPTKAEFLEFTGSEPEIDYELEPVRWLDHILNRPVSFFTVETASVIINDATKTVSWTGEVKLRSGSVMLAIPGGRPTVLHADEGERFSEFMEKSAEFLNEQQQIDIVKALHGAGLIKAEVRSR